MNIDKSCNRTPNMTTHSKQYELTLALIKYRISNSDWTVFEGVVHPVAMVISSPSQRLESSIISTKESEPYNLSANRERESHLKEHQK